MSSFNRGTQRQTGDSRVRLTRALRDTSGPSFPAEFFGLVSATAAVGGDWGAILQPSPIFIVARDMQQQGKEVGVAQLARIGSGYLYLKKVSSGLDCIHDTAHTHTKS
jgi:hypothetical protein